MKSKTRINHFFTLLLVIILITALASACDTNTTSPPQENSSSPDNQVPDIIEPPTTEPPATEPPATEPPATEPPATEPPPPDSPTIPNAPLSTTGPWIVFPWEESMWALNPDGSGIIPLVNFNTKSGFVEVSRIWAAPRGGHVAVLLIEFTGDFTIPHIFIVKLPNGIIEANIGLLPQDWDYESFSKDEKEAADQLYAAVGVRNRVAWSHDGAMLAFNAAIDGPTSDLYVYNTADKSTLRLTSDSSESVDPFFTITDSHIVHGAVSNLYYGRSGAGYHYQHVWAVRPDGSGVNKVFNHDFDGYEYFLGWTSYTTYLGESWENWCYSFNLRKIDINDGELETLYAGHYTSSAFADNYELFLFAIPNFIQERDICISGYQPGVYMMDTSTGNPTNIPQIPADNVTNITWQERSSLFFVLTDQGVMYSVSPSGSVAEYQAPKGQWNLPIFNLDGTKWAFVNSSKDKDILVIGGLNGEYIQLDVDYPNNPIWSPDSQWLLFFADHEDGPSLYAAPAPNYDPIVVESGFLDSFYFYGSPPVIVNP